MHGRGVELSRSPPGTAMRGSHFGRNRHFRCKNVSETKAFRSQGFPARRVPEWLFCTTFWIQHLRIFSCSIKIAKMHGNTWFGSYFCGFGGTSPGAWPRKTFFPITFYHQLPRASGTVPKTIFSFQKNVFGSITGISENRAKESFSKEAFSFKRMFLNQTCLSIPGYSLKIRMIFETDCTIQRNAVKRRLSGVSF